MKSYRAQTTARLLSFWESRDAFGPPIGCLATTYTFDAPFFEEQCLARFVGMESEPREDSRAYLIEREDRLSQVTTAVLVDLHHVPAARSLRWHLLPVRVPGAGIQHAKVTLLVWQKHVRLLLGSANLTEPGYRQNFEQMAVLDFAPDGGAPKRVLQDALAFLGRLRTHTPGGGARTKEGPQRAVAELLHRTARLTARWPKSPPRRGEPQLALVPVWPGERSVFDTVRRYLGPRVQPDYAEVLSPFYDQGPRAQRPLKALRALMPPRKSGEVRFFAPGRRLPGRHVEIDLPASYAESPDPNIDHHFAIIEEDTEDGRRSLHAKALWLSARARYAYLIGSSNFTAAGTGLAGQWTNVEANLLYVIPRSARSFRNQCHETFPDWHDLDLDRDDVTFIEKDDARTPETSPYQPLPGAFGLALYHPEGDQGRLELAIAATAPRGFRIRSDEHGGEEPLASHAHWTDAGTPASLSVPWPHPRPPSALLVEWPNSKGETVRGLWPVNVADASSLPPPEELRSLSLEELLEILTSARPLHEAVARILRRRAREEKRNLPKDVVDPHKKVDTSGFLLQRMRRVARALEGLRTRLTRPAHSLEAFRWRLRGPVGPLALAERLAESEDRRSSKAAPSGAAFLVAEVARTVKDADWTALERSLGRTAVRKELAFVRKQLRDCAHRAPAPPSLRQYVEEALRR